MESARWAFRCGSWTPSSGQWLFAARCIQREEKERIGRFMFARDAKFAMVRAGFCRSGSVPHFFHIMRRQFTDHEWAVIQGAGSEWTQLDMFYRHWVTMVTSDHHTLPYTCHKILPHIIGNWVSRLLLLSGSLMANGSKQRRQRCRDVNGKPHETLTGVHTGTENDTLWGWMMAPSVQKALCVKQAEKKPFGRPVADVAIQEDDWTSKISPPQQFTLLTFDDLISGAVPLADEDVQYWEDFQKKVDAPPQPAGPSH
nr:L-aminoadipate-semialdehyde dehydrogenase-phosphopantetheinyl transferase-like [Paramormyrops kingsleyae]